MLESLQLCFFLSSGEPTISEQLILAFELGSTGQSHNRLQNSLNNICGRQKRQRPNNQFPDPFQNNLGDILSGGSNCVILNNKICSATQVCQDQQGI